MFSKVPAWLQGRELQLEEEEDDDDEEEEEEEMSLSEKETKNIVTNAHHVVSKDSRSKIKKSKPYLIYRYREEKHSDGNY